MEKNRSLKAPSTMIKLPTHSGLPKFKILGNINNDTTIINSFQASANKCSSTTSIIPQRSFSPALSTKRPSSSQTTNTNVTTRIPSKPSGLAKPTPLRQIVSPVSTTPASKTNTISITKPSILRPMSGSRLAKPPINSTTIKKTKALTFNSPSYNNLAQQQQSQPVHSSNSRINTSTTITTTSAIANQLDLSTIPGDVGEIRRLLEALYEILTPSNEANKSDDNNNLLVEIERLKKENLELRETISGIKRATRLTGNSSVYYSPQS